MESKLLLDVSEDQIAIALLEDGRLVEYSTENRSAGFVVGNIYLAKVKKVMPGLNAAFVEVGYEKEGFLHYLDLGSNYYTVHQALVQLMQNQRRTPSMNRVQQQTELPREGAIANVLKAGDDVLVQVAKEPISTKGPRLTGEISIAGRSLVLIPFATKISVSQKITDNASRQRLKKALQSVKPQNYGVIVRTAAANYADDELREELTMLVKRWEEALRKIQKVKKQPALIIEEIGRAEAILRDHFNANYERVVVNDASVFEEMKSFMGRMDGGRADVVQFYDDALPMFDVYNVTKQVKSSFGRVVPIKKGAYLVIDHTEALHVIDVNSGTRLKQGSLQEDNAFEVNMLAVDETARQMRLRDMGGIVVIDLIDMHDADHKQQVYQRMRDNLQNDSARHQVLPLSKFCLMQITRQRVRPVTLVDTNEACPVCGGTGSIRSSLLFDGLLQTKLEVARYQLKQRRLRLYVHPYVYAFLKQGFPSQVLRWRIKFGWGVKVYPNQQLSYLQYQVTDGEGNDLDVATNTDMQ